MEEQHNPQEQASHSDADTQSASESRKGGSGPLIGVIIIVLVLVLGGLYFWGSQLNEGADTIFTSENANDDIANSDDEPEAIEDDLDDFNSAEFESQMEADINALESEF